MCYGVRCCLSSIVLTILTWQEMFAEHPQHLRVDGQSRGRVGTVQVQAQVAQAKTQTFKDDGVTAIARRRWEVQEKKKEN